MNLLQNFKKLKITPPKSPVTGRELEDETRDDWHGTAEEVKKKTDVKSGLFFGDMNLTAPEVVNHALEYDKTDRMPAVLTKAIRDIDGDGTPGERLAADVVGRPVDRTDVVRKAVHGFGDGAGTDRPSFPVSTEMTRTPAEIRWSPGNPVTPNRNRPPIAGIVKGEVRVTPQET